ncbi:MAG TPA: L-aspartate oxidase [Anaerolineaceae bacterium]|nr:L-aspartate oxidase [Anaerolineaceae bacterium]
MIESEVLIIGCGIAGATLALRLARDPQRRITIITREPDAMESNTRYAQGGVISLGLDDNPDLLVQDILKAGAGASSPKIARILAEEGPALLKEVIMETSGVQFDRDASGNLLWGNEAAHSRRRVLHIGDGTGKAMIEGLLGALRKCPNVQLVTNVTAVDLITFPHHSRDPLDTYLPVRCHGAYVFDRQERTIHRYSAAVTVLATGGAGRIYRNTSNPPGARGDGLAMAYRAGARITNAEYVQFHPTTLAVPSAEGFLISEAVRGEGAVLLTPEGRPFMADYSPEWKDLAPRDVVARAIHDQMVTHGYPHVLLDIASHMPAEKIPLRFPNIYATCLKAGIDMAHQPIPVMPAAHYFCGGVAVDEWGHSTIENLYAIGEVSCTGLHGANRLASTSLLEGLVWGNRAAQHIQHYLTNNTPVIPNRDQIPPWDESGLIADADQALIQGDMRTIQNIMWHYVGLTRSAILISRAIRELRHLWNEIETFYLTTRLSDGLIGLRNCLDVALIVAQAARHNRSSRGCHYRQDAVSFEGDRLI